MKYKVSYFIKKKKKDRIVFREIINEEGIRNVTGNKLTGDKINSAINNPPVSWPFPAPSP